MTRSLTWTDAAGVSTVLDGSAGIYVLVDPIGLEAPNPALSIDDYISFDGGVLVNRRRPARSIALKLRLEHPTRIEITVAALAAMLQGPGTLTYSDTVQSRTLRQVIYEAGLDGSGESVAAIRRIVVVSLLALDPWWYGPAASQVLPTAAPTGFDAALSFDSTLPFDGGGSVAVPVAGDVDAYPVFTVIGPTTTLVVSSGGLAWQVASPLGASDTLVVDHRPSSRGPRKNGGAVDWSLLSQASRLFPLARGAAVTVITGATGTTAATQLIMSYEPRYLTP